MLGSSLEDAGCASCSLVWTLSGSLGLRRATSLSLSSLFSRDDEAEDLPTPGILAIPLTSSELLRL